MALLHVVHVIYFHRWGLATNIRTNPARFYICLKIRKLYLDAELHTVWRKTVQQFETSVCFIMFNLYHSLDKYSRLFLPGMLSVHVIIILMSKYYGIFLKLSSCLLSCHLTMIVIFQKKILKKSTCILENKCQKRTIPVSILHKSIAGRYRPVSVADGPITARCRFIKNASWDIPTC